MFGLIAFASIAAALCAGDSRAQTPRRTWPVRREAPSTALTAYRKKRESRSDRLGPCRRKDRDLFAVGLVGAPLRLKPAEQCFHEVLHPDGMAYRQAEVDLIRELSGKSKYREAPCRANFPATLVSTILGVRL